MRITSRTAVRTGLAVFMAAVAIAGTTVNASAATGPDGFPIIHASAGGAAHTCTILGTDDDYHEAIVCVDINTMTYDGEAYAQGQVEAYCQDKSGTIVQCANITVEGEYAASGGLGALQPYYKFCGHQYGACPPAGDREYDTGPWVAASAEGDSTCGHILDSVAQVWSIAVGGETTIELPGSDDTYTLSNTSPNDGTNESTGHYYVCW
jgi:hypothetical protein